jgi:phage regulator Rha-like protein
MIRYIAIFITSILFASCTSSEKKQTQQKSEFLKKIELLMASKNDTLNLLEDTIDETSLKISTNDTLNVSFLDSVKIHPIVEDSVANSNLLLSHDSMIENKYISLKDYRSIAKSNILDITDKYVLFLVRNQSEEEVRAVTVDLEGKPIENIRLYYRLGNNEYQDLRNYQDKYYHYDQSKKEFTFEDSHNDTEWIVFPTKGETVTAFQLQFIVGIDENGHFIRKQAKFIKDYRNNSK